MDKAPYKKQQPTLDIKKLKYKKKKQSLFQIPPKPNEEIGKPNPEKIVRRKVNDVEYEQPVVPRGACDRQQSSGVSLFAGVPTYECRLREACEALDLESPNSDNTITDLSLRVCLLIEVYISSKTGTNATRMMNSRSIPRGTVFANPSENEALHSTVDGPNAPPTAAVTGVPPAPVSSNSSSFPLSNRQMLLESIIANRWLYRFEDEALESERVRLYKILRRYRYLLDARRCGRAERASASNPETTSVQTPSFQRVQNGASSTSSGTKHTAKDEARNSESMQPVSARDVEALPPLAFNVSTMATPRKQNSYQQN